MMMKLTTIFTVITLLVACSQTQSQAQNQPAKITAQDEEVVRNMKIELLAKAYEDQDTTLLSQILHEKYQLVDDGGEVYSKRDEIQYVSQYGPSYDTFVFEISKLELFDNGTALVFGTGTITGSDIQGNYSQSYKSSDVLVKEGGTWKFITSHVSGVKEVRE